MCRVGVDTNTCLSYESLTSASTRQKLRELPETDPHFFAELSRERNAPPLLTEEEVHLEDMESESPPPIDIPGDDSVVPLDAVEDAVHGLLPAAELNQAFIHGKYGLVSTAEAEETLVESIDGVVIDTSSSMARVLGRGQRKKFRNRNYLANFEFTHDSNVSD